MFKSLLSPRKIIFAFVLFFGLAGLVQAANSVSPELSYNSSTNSFSLLVPESGNTTYTYTLTYQRQGTSGTEGATDQVEAGELTTIPAETCSENDCIAHTVTAGHLIITKPKGNGTEEVFSDDFTIVNGAAVFSSDDATGGAKPSLSLTQCANGESGESEPCVDNAWKNGDLNPNNSHYQEGDSVPFRLILNNLEVGQTYQVAIEWDTTKNTKHAFDYLTTYNRTEGDADPCSDVLSAAQCASSSTYPIPLDGYMSSLPDWNGTQIAGNFTVFNGSITDVGPYVYTNLDSDPKASLIVTIIPTASGDAILSWGGHVGTQTDWGLGNSAVAISGSPYHMRVTEFECSSPSNCNAGHQDMQMQLGEPDPTTSPSPSPSPSVSPSPDVSPSPSPDVTPSPSVSPTPPATSSGTLSINKTNNVWPIDQQIGDVVTYTIQVSARDGEVQDVTTTDLPPEGFKYVPGSWTAFSSERGDLKAGGITTEPTYASPGDWWLDDMVAGEVVTLTYQAEIQPDVDGGVYPDMAWAEGSDGLGGTILAAAEPVGYVDPNFVGTQVSLVTGTADNPPGFAVQRTEDRTITRTNSNGQVLGASTEVLPETGAHEIFVQIGLLSFVVGMGLFLKGWFEQQGLQLTESKNWLQAKKRVSMVALVGLLLLMNAQHISAAGLNIRIEEIPGTTSQNNFSIDYVALDTQGRAVSVACFKKGPSDSGFTQFGATNALKAGGDSDRCQVDSSLINANGVYQFYVTATAGSDTAQSNTVSIDVKAGDGPSTPVNYSKSSESCGYKISFTTASDGKTTAVEVYRSDSTSFMADGSSLVSTVAIGPNQSYSFSNGKPDCNRTYYYAVRAFDSYGNGSGLVGDSEIKFNDTIIIQDGGTTTTQTSSTTRTAGARRVSAAQSQVGQGNDDTSAAAADSEITPAIDSNEGEAVPSQPSEAAAGEVLGATTDSSDNLLMRNKLPIFFGIVLATLLLTGIFLFNGKRK